MKKYLTLTLVLVALLSTSFAFAEGDSSGRSEQNKSNQSTPVVLTADQVTCVKNAISKREDALAAGHATYSTAITAAYAARKTALLAAWDKTDKLERRTAVRAADQAFKTSVRTARKTWVDARRGTWKTFETDRKACAPQAGAISASDTGSSKEEASL